MHRRRDHVIACLRRRCDDHVTGNAAYRREWPHARLIAHQAMRATMVADGATSRAAFLRSLPGTLGFLENLVSKRQGLDGEPTDDEEIAASRDYGDLLRRFAAETTSYVRVAPDITFGDSLLIHQDDRRIIVRWLGRGHTAGDATRAPAFYRHQPGAPGARITSPLMVDMMRPRP